MNEELRAEAVAFAVKAQNALLPEQATTEEHLHAEFTEQEKNVLAEIVRLAREGYVKTVDIDVTVVAT